MLTQQMAHLIIFAFTMQGYNSEYIVIMTKHKLKQGTSRLDKKIKHNELDYLFVQILE